MDLGECAKIHEYALRADYERAAATRNLYYEIDVRLINFCFGYKRGIFCL